MKVLALEKCFVVSHVNGKRGGYKMRYLHTMVRVKNLEQSMQFYCEYLGLRETHRYESEAGRFTLVYLAAPQDFDAAQESQAPLLELTYNWPSEDGAVEEYQGGRNFGHIAFLVDDIYQTCARLKSQGVIIHRPPRDGHMAFIKSPDGISIEFLQKGERLPAQEPWASMENEGSW